MHVAQGQQNGGADQGGDIASELADFSHQSRADALHLGRGQHENRFDAGRELAVHLRHLAFVIHVCAITDSAHDGLGTH